MLSYQHGYHAGNFADVIKHVSLCLIMDYMTLKDKPFFYLETHAGRGLYSLNDAKAVKTGEFQHGIGRLWKTRHLLPQEFASWIKRIEKFNNNTLRWYPGSPSLAIEALRSMDRIYCCELHPQEYNALQELPTQEKRVHYSNSDGLAALRSLLPPKEKRGLIMIDPSYEIKEEYKRVPDALHQAYLRFPTGVYVLWYPLIQNSYSEILHARIKKIPGLNKLNLEFNLNQSENSGMTGTGLWILNPPYVLEQQLNIVMQTLSQYFNPGKSTFHISC